MDREISIRVVTAGLPKTIRGACQKTGLDQYLIVINEGDQDPDQAGTFLHEMLHVWHEDFKSNLSCDQIEDQRHNEIMELLGVLKNRT